MSGSSGDPRDTFSGSAGRYLVSSDHSSGRDLEVIRELALRVFPAVTVDIATGAGHALKAAAPFSGRCIAVDLTSEMLHVAKEHLLAAGFTDLDYVQSLAQEMPFADSVVSMLTCRIAPHHFTSIPDFLDEAFRVLEPEGHCVIIDSIAPDDADCDGFINAVEKLRDPSHVRSHNLQQWLSFFRGAGLSPVRVELFQRTHDFMEWAARTGLDESGISCVETMFLKAPRAVGEYFHVRISDGGRVESYTDEKGIFVTKK